jgi:Protein of unknown function (DUF2934)
MDDDKEILEHQIELATRVASYMRDETTVQRLLRFADELRTKMLRSSKRRRTIALARELWEKAGCPSGRDLEFWLEAERQIGDEDRLGRGG